MFLFIFGKHVGVKLLSYQVILFNIVRDRELFSRMAASFYIPTSNI